MRLRKYIAHFLLLGYLGSCILSHLGYIQWNHTEAAEKNTQVTQLIALLVDKKIYNDLQGDIERYATKYLQKHYPLSKAMVLQIDTKEYTAPELVKLLENIYFDGIKNKNSRLIGTILIGDIPLPVVKYNDYIFPSIYPYVDFLEQKYLRSESEKYFIKNHDGGQAEIWHGILNFHTQQDNKNIKMYEKFFEKLKKYSGNPTNFVEKKIRYDDFMALKKSFLSDSYRLYINKLLFAEDLMYHRYTNLFASILQSDHETEIGSLINDLKNLQPGVSSEETPPLETWTKTPTMLLEQKIKSFIKDYHNLIGVPFQQTINENIKATDRRKGVADNHYQKLHLKDHILLGSTTSKGLIKNINDKLEKFVNNQIESEKYAMKLVIPTEYYEEKDKKINKRFFKKIVPDKKNTFRFFFFGKDAESINKAEDFSTYRGTFRNLSSLGKYSNIINDDFDNPIKSKYDPTDLKRKGLGASYDSFATQVEGNRAFNSLSMQKEYDLYQKEKQHAKMDWQCKKRRFGARLSRKFIPCSKVVWEPVGKCNPQSSNPKDQADCENFEQFGKRLRGGATPLNIDMKKISKGQYIFKGNYDPKSAWKPIFDIAGGVATSGAHPEAYHFIGYKNYISPTRVSSILGKELKPKEHRDENEFSFFNLNSKGKELKIKSQNSFSLTKPKRRKEDEKQEYHYKIIDSIIRHTASTPEQIEGYQGPKYTTGSQIHTYYEGLKDALNLEAFAGNTEVIEATKKRIDILSGKLITLWKSVEELEKAEKERYQKIDERNRAISTRDDNLKNLYRNITEKLKQFSERLGEQNIHDSLIGKFYNIKLYISDKTEKDNIINKISDTVENNSQDIKSSKEATESGNTDIQELEKNIQSLESGVQTRETTVWKNLLDSSLGASNTLGNNSLVSLLKDSPRTVFVQELKNYYENHKIHKTIRNTLLLSGENDYVQNVIAAITGVKATITQKNISISGRILFINETINSLIGFSQDITDENKEGINENEKLQNSLIDEISNECTGLLPYIWALHCPEKDNIKNLRQDIEDGNGNKKFQKNIKYLTNKNSHFTRIGSDLKNKVYTGLQEKNNTVNIEENNNVASAMEALSNARINLYNADITGKNLYQYTDLFTLMEEIKLLIKETNTILKEDYLAPLRNLLSSIKDTNFKDERPLGMYTPRYNEINGKINNYFIIIAQQLRNAKSLSTKLEQLNITISTHIQTLSERKKKNNFSGKQTDYIGAIGSGLGNTLLEKLDLLSGSLNASGENEGDCLGLLEELECTAGSKEEGKCVHNYNKGCKLGDEEKLPEFYQASSVIKELNELSDEFKSLFTPDSNNPDIEIPGMNILTSDRPIDSPRYVSFQGVGGNVVKLIYPNILKTEIFGGKEPILLLKTPEEIKQAIKKYLSDKVDEYNRILEDEKNTVSRIQNQYSDHFNILQGIDPLAAPSLDKRPYRPFTYADMLKAIGGENILNTLAELLYYQNISNQFRIPDDDIEKDIHEMKSTFDINQKIQYITNQYLTENKYNYWKNKKSEPDLILPNYSKKGYEVGYLNTNGNDRIYQDEEEIFHANGNQTLIQENNKTEDNTENTGADEEKCGKIDGEPLELRNERRQGMQCRWKEIKKGDRIKISFKISKGGFSVSDIDKVNNQQTNKPSAKLADILSNLKTTVAIKKLPAKGGTGTLTILSHKKTTSPLSFHLSSTGENCLFIAGKDTCKNSVSFTSNVYEKALNIPFSLVHSKAGRIALLIKICKDKDDCSTQTINLTAIHGKLSKIKIGDTSSVLGGAYMIFSPEAFDESENAIPRTLESYKLSVTTGHFIEGGLKTKEIEINDFTDEELIYQSPENGVGTAELKVQNQTGELITKTTINYIAGKMVIEKGIDNKTENIVAPIAYTINDEAPLLNEKINQNRLIPLKLHLEGRNLGNIKAPVIIGNHKNLVDTYRLENGKLGKISFITLHGTSPTTIFIKPKYKPGQETLTFTIPGLKSQTITINIHPGEAENLIFTTEKSELLPHSHTEATLTLQDRWGNKHTQDQNISITKVGPHSITPSGTITVKNGIQKFKISSNEKLSSSHFVAETQTSNGKQKATLKIKAKQLFIDQAIASGLNIMYLNLFGTDWGNQRGYFSEHKKVSEKIITNSSKTLAVTTQLVDPQKIKRTVAVLKPKKITTLGSENLNIILENNQLTAKLTEDSDFSFGLEENIKEIKVIKNGNEDTNILNSIRQNTTKTLVLFNINENISYSEGKLYTAEKKEIANLKKYITFDLTDEFLGEENIWNVMKDGEQLAQAVFINIDFTKIKNKLSGKFDIISTFINGTSNQTGLAIVGSETLKDSYQGYESIQDSDLTNKHIGFRANFQNITAFAGGKTVGEATIPFGSEFLINIGDPVVKRIEANKNLPETDHNAGPGEIVYSDEKGGIFKVMDIDYNKDGLRDLIVIYNNGTIKLQKQYEDKQFQDMGNLMLTADTIKETFIGDVDGNGYEDIILKNGNNQIRVYTNDQGVFDVDGRIACLNTNTKNGEINKKPESLKETSYLHIEDMNKDGKIDIVTLDKKGFLKIFYGEGNINNHSFLSTYSGSCDSQWHERQQKHTKTLKRFGLQITSQIITDESLIRRTNLKYEDDSEKAQDFNLDIPVPSEEKLKGLNIKKKEDMGKAEDLMKRLLGTIGNIDTTKIAQTIINTNTTLIKNPFENEITFPDSLEPKDQAFITINDLSTTDPVRVTKQYYKKGDSFLEEGDQVKVTVTITDKGGKMGAGATFFDSIIGPRKKTNPEKEDDILQNLEILEGNATFNKGIKQYDYYLTDITFSEKKRLIYTYTLTYKAPKSFLNIEIRDVDIKNFAKGLTKRSADEIPDIIIGSVDGCNKQRAILFNTNKAHLQKKDYEEVTVNLQQRADEEIKKNQNAQEKAKKDTTNKLINTDSQQSNTNKSSGVLNILKGIGEKFLDSGEIDINDVEKKIKDFADKMCNGFSFGIEGSKPCEGLPIPFNWALLAPGDYKVMGCFDIPPLSKTIGKGVPTMSFPGNRPSPMGFLPIPNFFGFPFRGLADDHFGGPKGGTYSSMLRLYIAPTLTMQVGIAMCFGPYNVASTAFPPYLPFGDIAGNCIVTSMPIPCGKENNNSTSNNTSESGETISTQAEEYGKTSTCKTPTNRKNTSSFKMVANNGNSDDSNGNNHTAYSDTFLGGFIDIEPSFDGEENEIEINGVKIQGVPRTTNEIVSGIEQGIRAIIVGRLDKQVKYWINNLFRFRIEVILPDIDEFMEKELKPLGEGFAELLAGFAKLGTGTTEKPEAKNTTKKIGDIGKDLWDDTKNTRRKEFNSKKYNPHASSKGTLSKTLSKEALKNSSLTAINNPFEKLKQLFNKTNLLRISTQKINVKIPRIASEDIEAYISYLHTWLENNKKVIDARSGSISNELKNCREKGKEVKKEVKETVKEVKETVKKRIAGDKKEGEADDKKEREAGDKKECRIYNHAMKQIIKIMAKFDKTTEQIYRNIEILQSYKSFPLDLYEWIHVSDKYIGDTIAFVSSLLGNINRWMELNANRFSQYVDTIITIIGIVKGYQVMIDLFADRGKKCGNCKNDTYDQYACKLKGICDLPIIPIPSMKIPNIFLDLSHFNFNTNIILPQFNFIAQGIELPRLPNLPEPPALGLYFDLDFEIPDIQELPELPTLPELPSIIPSVKIDLPNLPPAPKIPPLPREITGTLNLIKKLMKLFCIIKSGIGLVAEPSVKARIEQLTQRTYPIPWVDELNGKVSKVKARIDEFLKEPPLQGFDYQIDSYVNLQMNFDSFHNWLKDIVDTINEKTYATINQNLQKGVDKINEISDTITNGMQEGMDKIEEVGNIKVEGKVKTSSLQGLKKEIESIKDGLTEAGESRKYQELLAITSTPTTISPNNKGIHKIKTEAQKVLTNKHQEIKHLAHLIKSDYSTFLKTLKQEKKTTPLQLTFSTNLFDKNPLAESVITKNDPIQTYISTEEKRINGYMNALNRHSAAQLNMTEATYTKSKMYLAEIKNVLNQRYNLKSSEYAGSQTLTTKQGTLASRTLLTQTNNNQPNQLTTTDYSSYLKGIYTKNRKGNSVKAIASEQHTNNFVGYYQKDINNDKKSDFILWDDFTIYIKYADDKKYPISQKFNTYTVITPTLQRKSNKYENIKNPLFTTDEKLKLYDQNWEVKNFKFGGQNFDSLNFSRSHNKDDQIDGYLIRISENVDGLLEKKSTPVKYQLLLPKDTDWSKLQIQLGDSKPTNIDTLIGENKTIYEVKYYNPSKEKLETNLEKVPRKRQYLQITTLIKDQNTYKQNAPRSNQLVAGRQIIGDGVPPSPTVELLRVKKKGKVTDGGSDLEGFVGTYYDLKITRTDNIQLKDADISEIITKNNKETKIPLTHKELNGKEGIMVLSGLFFTQEQTKHYQISARDIQGNEQIENIALTIKSPTITIKNISTFSGNKKQIEKLVAVTAERDQEIDTGNVRFEKRRNGIISLLTGTYDNKQYGLYTIKTNQTEQKGQYYDFGKLIGLYSAKGELIATVNGENGEILIQPKYKDEITLKVAFENGFPIIKVFQQKTNIFNLHLQAENLVQTTIQKEWTRKNLKGDDFGRFDGGELIMKGNTPRLYIAQNGELGSNKKLVGSYSFNKENQTVTYQLKEHSFSTTIFATIVFKVKPL